MKRKTPGASVRDVMSVYRPVWERVSGLVGSGGAAVGGVQQRERSAVAMKAVLRPGVPGALVATTSLAERLDRAVTLLDDPERAEARPAVRSEAAFDEGLTGVTNGKRAAVLDQSRDVEHSPPQVLRRRGEVRIQPVADVDDEHCG